MDAKKKKLGDGHPETLLTMGKLAVIYMSLERWQAVEDVQSQVLKHQANLVGKDCREPLLGLANWAVSPASRDFWQLAAVLEKLLEATGKDEGQDDPMTWNAMDALAVAYAKMGRTQEAEGLLVRAIEAGKKNLGEDDPETIRRMHDLAHLHWGCEDRDRAKALMRGCVQLFEARLGSSHPLYLDSVKTLAKWETASSGCTSRLKSMASTLACRIRRFVSASLCQMAWRLGLTLAHAATSNLLTTEALPNRYGNAILQRPSVSTRAFREGTCDDSTYY